MKINLASTFFLALLTTGAWGQTRFIIRYTESEPLATFLARYDLDLEASVPQRPIHSVVDNQGRDPLQLINQISDDTDDDVSIELDQIVELPIQSFNQYQSANIASLNRALRDTTPTNSFGLRVTRGFATQLASRQTQADRSWRAHGLGNPKALVAVIDTGVDVNHPIFANSTVQGMDYITAGGQGSELTGLPEPIRLLINPTTTPLLKQKLHYVSRGHAALLERPLLLNSNLRQIPIGLGHGTMVAGAIKLVAPNAKILPIRAFNQNGTGRLFHVISAIHVAEIRGARVINLSFNTYAYSPELEQTSEDVSDRGVILVASTGNDGFTGLDSYPASFSKVTGVASISPLSVRSIFSNGGPDLAEVAAPGEALLLPFPGNRWAGGWGTSFSAPLVSGLAVKILTFKRDATYSDLQSALGRSKPIADPNMGHGELAIFDACAGL